jgi:hypothetical protein
VIRANWAFRLGGSLLAISALAADAGETEDAQLAARVARLHAKGAIEREFVETKQLALLTAPLESRGRMAFVPPDRLLWEIVAPEPSILRVEGGQVELSRPGAKSRRLDLSAEPGARGLVDAIRLLLAGDLGALRRDYALTLAEERDAWHLALTPRAEAQRRVVARIELAGMGDAPRELWLKFANGDLSHVAFVEAR